jgi:hypothetical protein
MEASLGMMNAGVATVGASCSDRLYRLSVDRAAATAESRSSRAALPGARNGRAGPDLLALVLVLAPVPKDDDVDEGMKRKTGGLGGRSKEPLRPKMLREDREDRDRVGEGVAGVSGREADIEDGDGESRASHEEAREDSEAVSESESGRDGERSGVAGVVGTVGTVPDVTLAPPSGTTVMVLLLGIDRRRVAERRGGVTGPVG